MFKYFLDLEIHEGESEVDTFNDARDHLVKNNIYPTMNIIKNTRAEKITVEGKDVKCISSYSYLDYGRDERVQQAAIDAANAYQSGNHGPRVLCGNLEILENLEKRIARFFKKEAALVFSSGFLACMSAICGFTRKGDLLVMDKLCHMSLKAGAKLSGSQIVYFKHNDFKDAERLIRKYKKNQKIIMVIEGVYSMDGDIGNLPVARTLCDKYGATLILDEAHSLGTIGKTGRGAEEYYEYKAYADIICGSFTKSVASVGGYLTCSNKLRQFYTFFAPGLVFSAPLSAYHAGAADKAFELMDKEPERITRLQENAKYLREKFKEHNFNIDQTITCVIPVIFRDIIQANNIHCWLKQNGYFTALVTAPAVPLDGPRFRITATASLTKKEMDDMVDAFCKAREANKESEKFKELILD
jgi:7-keto-8-aminopelargonate synthetase-like enzyme